jgi:hypothetical protein
MRISLLILVITVSIDSVSQRDNVYKLDTESSYFRVDDFVYNYFEEKFDSCVYMVGWQFLMPSDSVDFCSNTYDVSFTKGELKITYRKYLLFDYTIHKGFVSEGIIFYPFLRRQAVWAQFKKSKLHGLVITYDSDGRIMEIMKYRNGNYRYHQYSARVNPSVSGKFRMGSDLDNRVITQYR